MDAHDTPTTDTPDAATPVAADKPKKALAYTLVGGIIAFMAIALGVHLVQTNPPPANAAAGSSTKDRWGGTASTLPAVRGVNGVPDDLAASRAAFYDSPISTTLTCTGGGRLQATVSIFAAGSGSPIRTKWSGLSDDLRRGPTALYLTMATDKGEVWQMGQKFYGGTTYEQFSFSLTKTENRVEPKDPPGQANFIEIHSWGVAPKFKGAITDTTRDLFECN